MRDLGAALLAHLSQEVTTICFCWKIVRSDNTVIGFTNHDLDIEFDGVKYEASTGFSSSSMKSTDSLSVDDMEAQGILGALDSETITEQDLQNGLYDNADIEIYVVNWEDISQRSLERFGTIGEVERSGRFFKTEIRGYSHVLGQPFGRLYQRTCPYVVGDSECRVNLSGSTFIASGVVSTVDGRSVFHSTGLDMSASGWFTKGVLTWTSGHNTGRRIDVRSHGLENTISRIQILYPMGRDIQVGDSFSISAGCDNEFKTCKEKFNNAINFGGFPHMPGNDFIASYPNKGGGNDGSKLVD
jgi:uncharacterized phage protein (TIGR02218 family)